MHCHQSISDLKGNNLFYAEKDEYHLSSVAYGFIAGQLHHARGFSAVVAPTVNSYKRLVPGYEAPVYIGWAQTNRSALIRIPHYTEGQNNAVRAELRCPDPSCSPYLAFTAILAAGMDGIEKEMKPPKPLINMNVYHLSDEERLTKNIKELPGSLLEALNELDDCKVIQNALGKELYSAFRRAKLEEWDDFRIHVTDWETEHFLENS